jgi:hypothetical protein
VDWRRPQEASFGRPNLETAMEDNTTAPSPKLKNNQKKSVAGKNGERRPGAGRKKGSPNRLTADVKAGIT